MLLASRQSPIPITLRENTVNTNIDMTKVSSAMTILASAAVQIGQILIHCMRVAVRVH